MELLLMMLGLIILVGLIGSLYYSLLQKTKTDENCPLQMMVATREEFRI